MTRLGNYQLIARRGITLVEMLVSLALLSLLVVVSVSWMTSVVSRQNRDQRLARWDRAAGMVMDQVGHDLLQIELIDDTRRRGDPRVWIDQEALFVRTIENGILVTVRYAYEIQGDRVERIVRVPQAERNDDSMPLLGEVQSLTFELYLPDQQRVRPQLRMIIESVHGQSRSRDFMLNAEDVRQ